MNTMNRWSLNKSICKINKNTSVEESLTSNEESINEDKCIMTHQLSIIQDTIVCYP